MGIKVKRERWGFWLVIGSYATRINWDPGSFANGHWYDRWFSGWHRWDDDGV